jgi:hypothetical protein
VPTALRQAQTRLRNGTRTEEETYASAAARQAKIDR